jgi:hypothetical protein
MRTIYPVSGRSESLTQKTDPLQYLKRKFFPKLVEEGDPWIQEVAPVHWMIIQKEIPVRLIIWAVWKKWIGFQA